MKEYDGKCVMELVGGAAPALLPLQWVISLPSPKKACIFPSLHHLCIPKNNRIQQQLRECRKKTAELLTDEFIDTAASHCVKWVGLRMAEAEGSLRWPGLF